jgi:hypothetical protein
MNNNLKFEFNFDEVFEGIKQGVIKELSETNFDAARNQVVNQLKSEIKNKIYITYSDENELKNEVKKEVKDKVFDKLLDEARKEYKNNYAELFNKKNSLNFNEVEKEIKTKVINKLCDDLYSDLQHEMNTKIKTVVAKFVNNIGGKNLKIKGTDNIISKEEYDNLVHRNEILEALEQGGVDNWEWYGESLKQFFGDEED